MNDKEERSQEHGVEDEEQAPPGDTRPDGARYNVHIEHASGVAIVMQNHAGAGTALDALEIARRLDDPRFGLVYSPDHSFMHEATHGDELLPRIQPWTKQVYVADLVREGDGQRWVFPGEGEVPLRETIARLDAAGFEGFYSFKWEKIWHPDLAEPEVAMPHFIAFMESI